MTFEAFVEIYITDRKNGSGKTHGLSRSISSNEILPYFKENGSVRSSHGM